uniref:Peptidase S1 domain-containing protein n=1 Tax=Anopheles minimus TaxID=112268 RepID=A0A182VZF2_9DIPT
MAFLVYLTDYICSGTLIHPKYVLTARHCINSELVKVQLGKYDVEEESRQDVQEITISRKHKHVRYDVGLLLLAKPATLEPGHVQPICLPLYSSLQMYFPQTVTISGWGLTETNNPARVLMKANTPVSMSGTECNEDHMMCVGGVKNSNHCSGDSGGPYQAPILQLGNGRVCCVPPDPGRLISHRNAVKLAQLSCGTPGLELKIQNGTFAQRGEFPWMAILVYSTDLICSGTLIHPKYVLTTRHCIKSELVKVQLGKYDMEEDYTEWREEVLEITISRKLKHVRYDVGLLLLTKPATLQEGHVQPICLPLYSSLQMYLPQTVTISGWGVAFENQPMSVLRKANTPVLMSGKGCNEDHMICVGGVNHSNPCLGDSGGPYQALSKYGNNSGGRYVQYGIISEGPAICNRPVHPSRGVMEVSWQMLNISDVAIQTNDAFLFATVHRCTSVS